MADMNQLKRAVVELENGVQWVKALTEVGELKEETREQFQLLVEAAENLQKQQEQAQMTGKISSEELRQQQNMILSTLNENLEELRAVSRKQLDEHSEYIDKLQTIEQTMIADAADNADKLLERQSEVGNASADQIISSLTQQLQAHTEQVNIQLNNFAEQFEDVSKKLRRRIALNRWLTLGYAVIIIAVMVLFKFFI